jgi:hypothetical protein
MINKEDTIQSNDLFTLDQRRAFMKLSLEERRKILALQASQIVQHYESQQELTDRFQWQGGDIVDY